MRDGIQPTHTTRLENKDVGMDGRDRQQYPLSSNDVDIIFKGKSL